MMNIDNLNSNFSIEGEVSFKKQENGFTYLLVSNKFASAEICLYGAHVTSYIPHKTDQDKPLHGFARLMCWEVTRTETTPESGTIIRLQLSSSGKTKIYWPYDFIAEIILTVGEKLKITLKVTNISDNQFDYSCALHSYFNISAIGNICIKGLEGTMYHNQLEPGEFIQEPDELRIRQAETRHYYDTDSTCIIEDSIFRRKIRVAKSGSKITTVWNPGKETCARISDLPDDGYKTFICIETVNAFNDLIILNPGQSHETSSLIGPGK
jgi:glucose-6-phosphate 1-epimerase